MELKKRYCSLFKEKTEDSPDKDSTEKDEPQESDGELKTMIRDRFISPIYLCILQYLVGARQVHIQFLVEVSDIITLVESVVRNVLYMYPNRYQ